LKRGLVILDSDETSLEAFGSRLDAVRAKVKAASSSVALIYGDVSRSGDINYLTNLCLYWNEAILAVPLQGKPALITKLSKRVQPWMHKTSILDDIRSGPRLADNVGKFLDERFGTREGRVCVADMPWWPGGLIAQLRSALPAGELHDLAGAVRAERLVPSVDELQLLNDAARLLDESLAAAWKEGVDPHSRTAIAVRNIRRAGFQDASVNCGTLSDGSEYIDAIGQYRYVWVHQSQPRGGAMARSVNDSLWVAAAAIRPGMTETTLRELVSSRIGDGLKLTLSCIAHPDVETRGLYRFSDDSRRTLHAGEVIALTLSLSGNSGVVSAAETMKVTKDGAEPLFKRAAGKQETVDAQR